MPGLRSEVVSSKGGERTTESVVPIGFRSENSEGAPNWLRDMWLRSGGMSPHVVARRWRASRIRTQKSYAQDAAKRLPFVSSERRFGACLQMAWGGVWSCIIAFMTMQSCGGGSSTGGSGSHFPTVLESFCADLRAIHQYEDPPVVFVGRMTGFVLDPAVEIAQSEREADDDGETPEPPAVGKRTCVGKTSCRELATVEVLWTFAGEGRVSPGQVIGHCSDAIVDYPISAVYHLDMNAIFVAKTVGVLGESQCGGLTAASDMPTFGGYFAWFVSGTKDAEGEEVFSYDWRLPADANPGENPFGEERLELTFPQLAEVWEMAGSPPAQEPEPSPDTWPAWFEQCAGAVLDVSGDSFSAPPSCAVENGKMTCRGPQ